MGRDCVVECVVTDSRNNAPKGALFVALCSSTGDGHDYIGAMVERGVEAFLVSRSSEDVVGKVVKKGGSFVVVEDTLVALQKLAAWHRGQFEGTVVAITGSNGKTIVKEWFAQLWDGANGRLFRSPRSYNSQLGVALSLLMIDGDEKVAFIEAGISKVGEMEKLEAMIKPNVGVFTNLGAAHSEGFESLEEKRCEKEKLFKNCRTVVRARGGETIEEINKNLVLDIYKELGLQPRMVELKGVAMRLEVKEGVRGSVIINDSYSNDITSLKIALDFAARMPACRRVLVLSDVLGGGEKEVEQLVKDHKIDLFIGVGETIVKHDYSCETIFFHSTDEFLSALKESWFGSSVVLIKGGRAFEFERVVNRLEKRKHTTVLEVNLEVMANNLAHYKSMVSHETKIMAMVKAGGYGSGTVEVAAMLEHRNVDYLAVAYADEGVELRKGGIHMPIVVLNSDCESYGVMIENRLEPEIYSFEALESFCEEAVKRGCERLPIHIKIDSGMHRLGFMKEHIGQLVSILNSQNAVYVASIFSHFAASEDHKEDDFTRSQAQYFRSCADVICEQVAEPVKPILHICNTAAIGRFPQYHFGMVRVGVGLYTHNVVSRLVSKIAQVKTLEVGETVGYNRRGKISGTTKIAILPIGYADGLFRAFGNGVAKFNVGGVLCPTIGNICMDTCIVDVSAVSNVKAGDEVVIFGQNPTADTLAKAIGTIDYEILTSVAGRIKRIYISE